ncbi:helix-turn-helix domain-containing protein [Sphingobium sp. H39-3-25]|uniref:winged helix-turn-helix transcriptional regulator n=1 Tax=Sphingobium arseniciresistens TaxID=3030834 RepID=UPI0023B97A5A|nr:helix-turn-helix domain-containing protein [Sphingobium arseniciresistens]
MDTEKFSNGTCPVARALLRVGDSWSMMILRDAAYGATRFDQFRISLGIAPNILTRRLASLTENGLLEKRRYSLRPPRDEYVLTEKGRDFLPILAVIGAWGRKYHGEGGTSQMFDSETGLPIEPVVVDGVTGRPLSSISTRLILPERTL